MHICDVYVQHPVFAINQTYTYRCDANLKKGQRVLIPFGHQELIGLVHDVREVDDVKELKPITKVIDETQLLNDELYEIADWLETHTIAPYMAGIQAMLPTILKPRKAKQLQGKQIRYVKAQLNHNVEAMTKKERQAYEYLLAQGPVTYTEFRTHFTSVAKRMVDQNLCLTFEEEAKAILADTKQSQPLILNEEQQAAVNTITSSNTYQPFLLHGVTGSGKTEVYLQSASEIIKQGKQVLLLVPEISLTPQMVERVKSRFPNQVAIYHSRLNAQERYEQYQLVLEGKVNIAVGTRSAIFLPFTNLGLIILDEEHDKSYKQESVPRYHAKDIALLRGTYHQCSVVFASATPSLEAYARAIKQVYTLIELKHRVNDCLPEVAIVDMREENRQHHFKKISRALHQEIVGCLSRNEQVILLMNRRGYVPILRCKKCKDVIQCPHCDISLSYHKEAGKLKCHYCDHEQSYPSVCPSCQYPQLEWLGYGIQLLEEEVKQSFPTARVLRMDRDTTSKKGGHESLIQAFANHEADILIGTQMIAKGLDFEHVTCVGILNADVGLYRSDFRALEDTFQLVTQACGRSGRADKPGKVFIQSYDVEHYAITYASQHDYLSFFRKEMKYRHLGDYPPYCYLASIVISHKQEEDLQRMALEIRQFLKNEFHDPYKIYGPSELVKVKDMYRRRILIKSKDEMLLEEMLRRIVVEFQQNRKLRLQMDVDMNPSTLE